MKENRLTIQINKPAEAVFEFTINPRNTPLWIDSITKEEAQFPIGLNTHYRNFNIKNEANEYVVTKFELNKIFEITMLGADYKVRYTYTPISENLTELEYFEWSEKGEISDPFTRQTLEKLKQALELDKQPISSQPKRPTP